MDLLHSDKERFKVLLKANMQLIGLTLTEEIAYEIIDSCVHHVVDSNQQFLSLEYPQSATKDFHFFYGEEKRFVQITVSQSVFPNFVTLDFDLRNIENTLSDRLFSFPFFDRYYRISPVSHIVADLQKTFHPVEKTVLEEAIIDVISTGEVTFLNHLNHPVTVSYYLDVLKVLDGSQSLLRQYRLPETLSELGLTPSLRQYCNLKIESPTHDRKIPASRRQIHPTGLIDLLYDIYHYFDVNALDGLDFLKACLDTPTVTKEKVTFTVMNGTAPIIEVVRLGHHPRRRCTYYMLTQEIIDEIITR